MSDTLQARTSRAVTSRAEETISQVTLVCECGRRNEIRIALAADGGRAAFACPLLPAVEQSPLSAFVTEVLQHIAAGQTDREIARELDQSISSVRYAIREAIARLSTRNRTEAVFVSVPRSGGLSRWRSGVEIPVT